MGTLDELTPAEHSWAVADEARGYIADVVIDPLDVDQLEVRIKRSNHLVEPAVVLELIDLLRREKDSSTLSE